MDQSMEEVNKWMDGYCTHLILPQKKEKETISNLERDSRSDDKLETMKGHQERNG